MATGAYVCSLDDDSCFVQPDALERAVARMEAEKEVGIITFFVHHAKKLPERPAPAPPERYTASYIGCAHMIRRQVIEDLGGYRDFYFYYGEEAEYSLRALESGWRILFYPDVVVQHRVSPAGRDQSRVLGYSFRNNLFTILLNMPWRRAAPELAWKLASYGIEALRRLEFRPTLWALGSLTSHLSELRSLRAPVSRRTVCLYDALRLTTVTSADAFRQPPRVGLGQRLAWLRETWWRRRRARAFWDRGAGGVGRSETAAFGQQGEGRYGPSRSSN
jgi:GT2 family glycosyltransferase